MSWFTTERLDNDTFAISEYRHPEETHCYLLRGGERCLLIDTGLGISNISLEASLLTDKPVIAAPTHIHWDHIGGLSGFDEFCVHPNELEWISGEFPLPAAAVREMLAEGDLPSEFDLDGFTIFQGEPTRLLNDGDEIALGGRTVSVLHTPGHSPGHICFWEEERGYLFTGDLVYGGTIFANYPSTNPDALLRSVERLAELPVKRLFPGHHSLDVRPSLVVEIAGELRRLKRAGKLCHGSGQFSFGEWSVLL